MRQLLDRLFDLYGKTAILERAGVQKRVQVFFQGSNSKSWQNMERVYGPLGEIPRGQSLCFLRSGTAKVGDGLWLQGRAYRICRVEDMLLGEHVLYQWCLCAQKGRTDAWSLTE